jgi:hypothetical protein
MFFYSVHPDDFRLLHFSDPFIIEKPISAYLDFPVGLTQFEDKILLSYGHGDCASYIATFPQDVYNGLLRHDNDTKPRDIHYNIYDPEMGQISYGTVAGGRSRKRSAKRKTRKRR